MTATDSGAMNIVRTYDRLGFSTSPATVDALSQPMKFHIATRTPVRRVPSPASAATPLPMVGEKNAFAERMRKGHSRTTAITTAEFPTLRTPLKFHAAQTAITMAPVSIPIAGFFRAGNNLLA